MTMDSTRKWIRKQFLLALGIPAGIVITALVLLLLVPDYRDYRLNINDYYHFILWISRPAGLVALVSGGIAVAWSFCILMAISRMGRAALQSRDVLLQQFARGHRWLVYNIVMIALLLLTAASSVMLQTAALVLYRKWMDVFGAVALVLLVGGLVLLCKVYLTLVRRHEAEDDTAFGRAVSRQEAPLVWKLVDEVTRNAHVVAPDNIILGLDATFYATEAPLYLNSAQTPITGRSLYLSVPYLAYLTRDEAAVIIGHELAHFTGADTEYTLKFAEIYTTTQRQYHALYPGDANIWMGMAAPVRALFAYYLSAFDLAVKHWSRERELLADRIGAGAVNHEAAVRALMCTTTLASVIEAVLYDFHHHRGKTAHPGGLLEQVFEAVRAAGPLDPMAHLQDSQPHPRDSHPPTIQRIEALGITPDPELAARVNRHEPGELLQELGLK